MTSVRSIALVIVATSIGLVACGVPNGDADRHEVEVRTCKALLARLGLPADGVDADRFVEVLGKYRASDRPYSSVEPFLRACRSFE